MLIAAASSCAGAMGGLYFSKRVKARAAYYEALVGFINQIISEIKFRKNPIKIIAEEYMKMKVSALNTHLTEYVQSPNPTSLQLSRGVLKPNELERVRLFLESLGTLDSETQILELEAHKEKFSLEAKKTLEHQQKFSGMYVKLGFFAGLALGIIIL